MVGVNYLTVAAQTPNGEQLRSGTRKNAGRQANACRPASRCRSTTWCRSKACRRWSRFLTQGGPTFIVGSLSPVDQHVTFTISDIHPPSETSPPIIESRLVFFSAKETNVLNPAADGTYLTMPSNCAGGQVSKLHLDTQGPPYEAEASSTEASYTTPTGATGCDERAVQP